MKPQHVELQNEFTSKCSFGTKFTRITGGNILVVCPSDLFDALGQYLLDGKNRWVTARRSDNGADEFYPFQPYTPFSKYQSLKKTSEVCVKLMTLQKGRVKLTVTNGVLPPGSNELDDTKYLWDGSNTILNLIWTNRKPAGTFSSLKGLMGGGGGAGGSSSKSNSNPSDPFSHDEIFKWIHRYINVESCECRPDSSFQQANKSAEEAQQCRKTSLRVENIAKSLTDLFKPDKIFSSAKPCPFWRCADKDCFTLKIYGTKPDALFAILERLSEESVLTSQLLSFHTDMRNHEKQVNSASSKIKSKWRSVKSAVSEQANVMTGAQDEEEKQDNFDDYVPKMPSKAGMLKSMLLG